MSYNAVNVENDVIFNEIFLKENMTRGVYYLDDETNEVVVDESSLEFINIIVRDIDRLNEIFRKFPSIDFDKQMGLIYAYTSSVIRKRKIVNITLDATNLNIDFKHVKGKSGHNDTSMPQRRFLIIRMDKINIELVHFKLLNPNK